MLGPTGFGYEKPMRRRIALVVAVLVLLVVGGAIAAWRWVEAAAQEPVVGADVVFDVQKGASGPRVPKLLADAKLLADPRRAQLYVKLHPAYPKFGKHQLKAGMTLAQVLEALAEKPLPDDSPVTILEGWRLLDTDKALSSLTPPLIAPGAYLKAAKSVGRYPIPFELSAGNLEGYLYPETYLLPTGQHRPRSCSSSGSSTSFAARVHEPASRGDRQERPHRCTSW